MAKATERMLWPLPQGDGPWEYVDICIPIPDDEQHRRNFLGAILALSKWYNYDRDDLHRGTIAASAWDYTFNQMAATISSGEGCGEEMTCCEDIMVILNRMEQEQIANVVGALPVSVVAPNAPTKGFLNGKETTSATELNKRMRSLCDVIYNYLGAVMTNLASFITDSLTVENILGIRDTFTELPLTGVTQAFISLILTPAVVVAFQDEDAIREFVCCFRDGLANATDAGFTSFNHVLSQVVCDYQNPHAIEIHNIMYWANRDERNYKLFMGALSDEYSTDIDETVGSTGDCDFCGDPCTTYRNLGASPFGVRVTQGIWVPGVGFKGEPYTTPQGVAYTRLWVEILCPSPGAVRTVEVDVAYKNNGGGGSMFVAKMNGTTVMIESGGFGGGTNIRGTSIYTTPNVQHTTDRIRIRQDTPVSAGSITLYGIKAGPGDPPLP